MSIVYLLILVLLSVPLAVCWVVSITCALAWYEYANRDPLLLDQRHLPERQWLSVRFMLMEVGSILIALTAHPFGHLPVRPPRATTTTVRPVILLHGLFYNRASWFVMKQRLERCGFVVVTVNLPPWHDLETLARRLAETVEDTAIAFDVDRVDLVGHSMGGILARYFVQMKGGDQRVGRCVLLATPNAGSKLAPFALSPLGRLVMPGSEFIQELNAAPWPKGVGCTAIYSRHDNIVLPCESATLAAAENIELEWLGHASLLIHEDAALAVIDALRTNA